MKARKLKNVHKRQRSSCLNFKKCLALHDNWSFWAGENPNRFRLVRGPHHIKAAARRLRNKELLFSTFSAYWSRRREQVRDGEGLEVSGPSIHLG